MRKLLLALALSLTSTAAFAQGELTCWYNEAGQSTGADSGTHGAPVGQVTHDRPGHSPPSTGDWYWAYVLGAGQWSSGQSCPPALDMSAYNQTTDPGYAQSPLTCWYNDYGQSQGADSGNWANAPLRTVSPNAGGAGGGSWVFVLGPGEWTDGNSCPDSINIAGSAPVTGDPVAQGPNYNLTPTYGSVVLNSGFQPDPHRVGVYAGGNIVSDQVLPECYAGWIAEAPDYRLTFTAGTYPLTFLVESGGDTTLAINDPNGNWHCNDDSDGLNPAIRFNAPLSGQYDIWVGAFGNAGDYPTATLTITEY